MIKDSASLKDIVSLLSDEQKKEFDNSGIYGVVQKFGTRTEDRVILKTSLGNLITCDDTTKLVTTPIGINLHQPVLLVGAFKWRLFDDNLEIHI